MDQQTEETIRLDQFLKLHHLAQTGGHAKLLIQSGDVRVNGKQETRRRRKLREGDLVEVAVQELSTGVDSSEGEVVKYLSLNVGKPQN